jgi:uncharacterized membrane protein YgcG
MEVAVLTVRVEADFSKLTAQMAQLEALSKGTAANMKIASDSVQGLSKVAKDTANNVRDKNRAMQDSASSSGNLGRAMRELTTSIFGTNLAAIALGTALGNVLTQAVSRMLINLAAVVTQFDTLRNELAAIQPFMNNIGREFDFISTMAATSNRSLQEVGNEWKEFGKAMQSSLADINNVRDAYIRWNIALGINRVETIATATNNFGTQLGDLIYRLDNTLGISKGLIMTFDAMANALQYLASMAGMPKSNLENLTESLRMQVVTIKTEEQALENVKRGWTKVNDVKAYILRAEKSLNELYVGQGKLLEQIAAAKAEDPKMVERRADAEKEIELTLANQVRVGSQLRSEQEIMNQMFQIELQFLRMGLDLRKAENQVRRQNLEEQVRAAQAASAYQGIRESLSNSERLEKDSYAVRLSQLEEFYNTGKLIDADYRALRENEEARHQYKLEAIRKTANDHMLNAQMKTGQALLAVMQILGQKSKGWAIAALAVSTALNVARAIQSTAAAVMAVAADPTIPFPAKPAVIAGVKALGAVEIGLIIAAGALQMGSAGSGVGGGSLSGGGGGGGGGGGSPVVPEELGPQGRSVTVLMTRGQLYSSDQLKEFIERINEEVKNGATLIATETVP